MNRVTGGNRSDLMGRLQADGSVVLLNPNGILIGKSGRVDVAGSFLASTLDMTDADFLNGGDTSLTGDSSRGAVINLGAISSTGGDVFLVAPRVENEGSVEARQGTVGLAGGTSVLLTEAGDERVAVRASGGGGEVINRGSVEASVAELKSHGGNIMGMAVRNEGRIAATGATRQGGRVFLSAGRGGVKQTGTIRARRIGGDGGTVQIDAGSEGTVEVSGSVDVGSETGTGGEVEVLGRQIEADAGAEIVASGAAAGGDIYVGGGERGKDPVRPNAESVIIADGATLRADGTGEGAAGGRVVTFAEGSMEFRGEISAAGGENGAGGFAEVSGLESLQFLGEVDTGGGDLLLDPFNYIIKGDEAGAIAKALNDGNNVTIDTTEPSAEGADDVDGVDGIGNISIESDILYSSDSDLTFLAMGDVAFGASVQNRGASGGDLNVVAGWDGTTDFAADMPSSSFGLDPDGNGGQGRGSVRIGDGNGTGEIAVGSRSGQTNVFAFDVELNGVGAGADADGFALLGFQISDGKVIGGSDIGTDARVDGPIEVRARGAVRLNGGAEEFAYAQIGHVGADLEPGKGAEAMVDARIRVRAGGDVTVSGGSGKHAYGQIGHGGRGGVGDHKGAIIVRARDIRFQGGEGGEAESSYAQLGHGGDIALGSHDGHITVNASGSITFEASNASKTRSYAHLGHGGTEADGDNMGNIEVTAVDSVVFEAGTSPGAYVQLGHGGDEVTGDHDGDIVVRVHTGLIGEDPGGGAKLELVAPSGANAFAQLGHGGAQSEGDHSGEIDVVSHGTLSQTGEVDVVGKFGRIGHGDAGDTADGDVTVRVAGDATLHAAFIGHQTGQGGYTSGSTVIGVGGPLTADEFSSFTSSPFDPADSPDGNLRIYLRNVDSDGVDESALLNRAKHGAGKAPRLVAGENAFGEGPYPDPSGGPNFAYYTMPPTFSYAVDEAGESAKIADTLNNGEGVALRLEGVDLENTGFAANPEDFGAIYDFIGPQFITIESAIQYDSANDLALDLGGVEDGLITVDAPLTNSGDGLMGFRANEILLQDDIMTAGRLVAEAGGPAAEAGRIEVDGDIDAALGARFTGGDGLDQFDFEIVPTTIPDFDGGAGEAEIDFSAVTAGSPLTLDLSEIALVNIREVIGTEDPDDRVVGPADASDFLLTGSDVFQLVDSAKFSRFENLTGGGNRDHFGMEAGASLTGTLDGGGERDELDYGSFGGPVEVNLELGTFTGLGGVSRVETIVGSAAMTDSVIGPDAPTNYTLTGVDSFRGGGIPSFFDFEDLTGGRGNDEFAMQRGARLTGVLDGGGGRNFLNYRNFGARVSVDVGPASTATGIAGGFVNVGEFTGSTGSADTFTRKGIFDDTYTLTAQNTGTLRSRGVPGTVRFDGFENLDGGEGNDHFELRNRASVDGRISGGPQTAGGEDTLLVDDANQRVARSYSISNGRISDDLTLRFDGIEELTLSLGSGDDSVTTDFFRFAQDLDGGAETVGDTLIFPSDPVNPMSPATSPGFGTVTFTDFEVSDNFLTAVFSSALGIQNTGAVPVLVLTSIGAGAGNISASFEIDGGGVSQRSGGGNLPETLVESLNTDSFVELLNLLGLEDEAAELGLGNSVRVTVTDIAARLVSGSTDVEFIGSLPRPLQEALDEEAFQDLLAALAGTE